MHKDMATSYYEKLTKLVKKNIHSGKIKEADDLLDAWLLSGFRITDAVEYGGDPICISLLKMGANGQDVLWRCFDRNNIKYSSEVKDQIGTAGTLLHIAAWQPESVALPFLTEWHRRGLPVSSDIEFNSPIGIVLTSSHYNQKGNFKVIKKLLDMGCVRFATLSDGIYVEPCDFKRQEQRLKKYQRRMSRKVKFSQNWKKEKTKIQKVSAKIANIRNDFIHKVTTEIVKNHALVIMEDLSVKKMTKSLSGTPATAGAKAKKRNLNRSILGQGWHEFARQMEYKMAWAGGIFLKVPAYYTSLTCPKENCGHIDKKNRKTQALFKCVACGYEDNADLVSAINVEARGHRVLSGEKLDFSACGGGGRRLRAAKLSSISLMKQEPAEALEDIPL